MNDYCVSIGRDKEHFYYFYVHAEEARREKTKFEDRLYFYIKNKIVVTVLYKDLVKLEKVKGDNLIEINLD